MKLFLGVMLCAFIVVFLSFQSSVFQAWAETEQPPKHSIIGTWTSSIGDVHYEFVIDETHLSGMGEKVKYTAVYEGSWVLMKIKAPNEQTIAILLKFHGADKLEILCLGTPPKGGVASLARKK